MLRIIPLLLSTLLVLGCTTPQKAYLGDTRSASSLSIISPPPASLFRTGPLVNIRQVDKNKLDKLKSGAYEVLPGEHTIYVILFQVPGAMGGVYMKTQPTRMTFTTEPGKKYIVDYQFKDDKAKFFVIEESTGNNIPWH